MYYEEENEFLYFDVTKETFDQARWNRYVAKAMIRKLIKYEPSREGLELYNKLWGIVESSDKKIANNNEERLLAEEF